MKEVFTKIFKTGEWRSSPSDPVSGPGSTMARTRNLKEKLEALFQVRKFKNILDIPCGDHLWMAWVMFPIQTDYMGADIVTDLIEANQKKYVEEFHVMDICTSDLPIVELVFVRDCLGHFSYVDIARALANIKRSDSTYLMTTTFTVRTDNIDCRTGTWRPINLMAPPFDFGDPLLIINEHHNGAWGKYCDKSMGLWRVEDIPDAFIKQFINPKSS
jgi:methyltransferase family protein